MDLWPLIPTGSSRVPDNSGPHLHLIWTWSFWSAPESTLDLVTVVPTWASPVLGTPVSIWASPGPVDHGPQLGKIGTR